MYNMQMNDEAKLIYDTLPINYLTNNFNNDYSEINKQCSQIIIYNISTAAVRWAITLLDGRRVFISDYSKKYEQCIIDLESLNLAPETEFIIEGIFDIWPDFKDNKVILTYMPHSNAIYSMLKLSVSFNELIFYTNVLSPNSPPILKCSKISANHTDGGLILHWGITTSSGTLIFKSEKCRKAHTFNYNLSELNIPDGTQLLLKGIVSGGDDSIGYILLEYDSLSDTTAYFGFYGNAFQSLTTYNGS